MSARWLCRLLTLIAGGLLLGGCGSLLGGKTEIPERRKFILQPTSLRLSLPKSERPYPYKVQIEKFAVSRLYDRDQIVFRLSPEEIREDRWHVWAVRPSEMITDAAEQYLKDAHLFTDIRQEFLDASPDFTFTGTVKAIERYDSVDQWYALLTITMQLVDRHNEVIWQRSFGGDRDDAQEVYNADFSHTVVTMKELLSTYMKQAIEEIDLQVHIRMLHDAGKPLDDLLAATSGETPAPADSAATGLEDRIPGAHPHYVIIPGKLAPESE